MEGHQSERLQADGVTGSGRQEILEILEILVSLTRCVVELWVRLWINIYEGFRFFFSSTSGPSVVYFSVNWSWLVFKL